MTENHSYSHSPSVAQFAAWIRAEVARLEPGTALPTDTQLAQRWGFARKTVGNVMRELAAEGLVERTRRRGTCAAGLPQSQLEPAGRISSAAALAASIRADIESGRLRSGELLPAVQFTAHRQRVSPHTVIAAYRLLTREGLVHKAGRSYRCGVPGLRGERAGNAPVMVVSYDTIDLRRLFGDPSYGRAYFELEEELARHGRTVRYMPLSRLPAGDTAAQWSGMLFAQPAPGDRALRGNPLADQRLRQLFARVPSVVDLKRQTTAGKSPSAFLPRRPPRCLYLYRPWLSRTLKTTLVDYIVGRRYRHVRFILDVSQVARHFPGLAEQVSGHRSEHPTPPFVVFWDLLDIRKQLESVCPSVRFSLSLLNLAPSEPLARSIRTHLSAIPPSRYSSAESSAALSSELSFHRTPHDICRSAREGELWVCKTDGIADAMLRAARDSRIDIPGRVDMLSFDNDPAYYHLGLSRCEIDWQGVGYLMAHWFIGDIPVAHTREGYLRGGGRVVEKSTTRLTGAGL